MPNPYSPYQEAGHAVDRLSGGLNKIIVGLAQQRYQQQQAARQAAEQERQFNLELQFKQAQLQRQGALDKQRGSLLDAQTQNALAMGGLNKQKENELANSTAARMNVGQHASIYSLANHQFMDEELRPSFAREMEGTRAESLARIAENMPLVNSNPNQLTDSLIKLFNQGNPEVSAAMATGTKLRTALPLNNQLVDMLTGQTKNAGIINQPPGYVATEVATGKEMARSPYEPRKSNNDVATLQSLNKRLGDLMVLGKVPEANQKEYDEVKSKISLYQDEIDADVNARRQKRLGQSGPPPMPPKEQLEVGKTYTAPNGQIMSWTGTGFVPATNGPTKLNLNLRQ